MANSSRKLIDLTGAPFVVEKAEDGKYYIIGVKLGKRLFLFSNGIPEEIVDKISGDSGNGQIDGLEEIADFFEDIPEGTKLKEAIPEEYVDDESVVDTWKQIINNAASGNNS